MTKIWTPGNRNPFVMPEWFPEPVQNEATSWQKIADRIALRVARIYYPCCFKDRSMSTLFPNSHFTYLDSDPNSFQNERISDITTIWDAHNFTCDPPVDLGILKNPVILPKLFLNSVKGGWYIVANNHHWIAWLLAREWKSQLLGCESSLYGWVGSEKALEHLEKEPWSMSFLVADDLYLFAKK